MCVRDENRFKVFCCAILQTVKLFYGDSEKTHFNVIICHFHIMSTLSSHNYKDDWKRSSNSPPTFWIPTYAHTYYLNHAHFPNRNRFECQNTITKSHRILLLCIYIHWLMMRDSEWISDGQLVWRKYYNADGHVVCWFTFPPTLSLSLFPSIISTSGDVSRELFASTTLQIIGSLVWSLNLFLLAQIIIILLEMLNTNEIIK